MRKMRGLRAPAGVPPKPKDHDLEAFQRISYQNPEWDSALESPANIFIRFRFDENKYET